MTTSWWVTQSPDGCGQWFVAEESLVLSVYAAPGVGLPDPYANLVDETALEGWRRAVWTLDDELAIEVDPPVTTFRVTTVEVCCGMPDGLRSMVRTLMVDQLHLALTFGESSPRELVVDAEAQARQASVAWILSELREAFPDEQWEQPQPLMQFAVIPDTSDELLSRIPAPKHGSIDFLDMDDALSSTPPTGVRQAFVLLVSLLLERVVQTCMTLHYPHLVQPVAPEEVPPARQRPASLV